MKFRKKPVEIEAVQWLKAGDHPEVKIHTQGGDVFVNGQHYIDTLEGKMLVTPGDWIIRGVKGELYPCKPDIFEATYEPVSTDSGMNSGDLIPIAERERSMIELREWAVSRWRAEVQHRPLLNKHRRALDDCWRQVMIYAGIDPDAAVGLSHDTMLAAGSAEMARRDSLGPWEDKA